ncbi:hypothetical protein ACE6H2_010720 [Prunus campanulata]
MKYIPLFSSIFPSTPHFLASISIQSITPLIFRNFSAMASWPSLSNPSNQSTKEKRKDLDLGSGSGVVEIIRDRGHGTLEG